MVQKFYFVYENTLFYNDLRAYLFASCITKIMYHDQRNGIGSKNFT